MSRTLSKSPVADGFWMPAEFEPHAGTWMLWPERPDNWRNDALPAQRAFFESARILLPEHIRIVEMSHDDCWARDTCPTFVVNETGGVRGVHWRFNAWGGHQGGLYSPWDQDELVARKVLEIERRDRYLPGIINEGGAIHVDGAGTALVTEECLLNPNRNPDLTRAQIEAKLRAFLG